MWSLQPYIICASLLPQAANCLTAELLVSLEPRNMIATAIADMINLSFVAHRKRRVFNFYAFIGHQSTQSRVGFFGEIMDESVRRTGRLTGDAITMRIGYGEPVPGDNERHYGVLLVDCAAALKLLYRYLLQYHMHITGYYIIVLHTFEAYYYDELIKVFALNKAASIVHANVLIYALKKELLVFSGYPYNRFHCFGLAPVIINRFDGKEWQRRTPHFFMDKLMDLHGCTLICATWMDMPYFEVDQYGPAKRDIKLLGIEGKLLEYLAARMNFTLQFYWMSDSEKQQTLEIEGAVFDKLFANGIDFAIGAFHYRPTTSVISYTPTNPYYLSYYNFVIDVHTEPYPAFVKLLFPFATDIWSLLLICLLAGCMLCLIISCRLNSAQRDFLLGVRNSTPLYNMFVVGMGGPVPKFPRRNFARYLLLIWLYSTLVLRTAYVGFMYHYIRTDINIPPPSRIEELIARNYTFYMTNTTHNAVQNLPILSELAQVINVSDYNAFDWMRVNNSTSGKHAAVLSAYEYFGYFKRKHILSSKGLYVVPDKVFMQQLSIYMRKNSELLTRFNRYIIEFVNAGLMSKWEGVFLEQYKPWTVLRPNYDETIQPQKMQLATLDGTFGLLIAGAALSACVFLIEWLTYIVSVCLCWMMQFGVRLWRRLSGWIAANQ